MRKATSVTITDPLVKYQSLVAAGVYRPDLAQHRLAHHLQKLYVRLKDYNPSSEHRNRLQQVSRVLKTNHDNQLAVEGHPIWRNPLFSKLLRRVERQDSLALTRVLTSHQAAQEVDSPKGLFLSGEVGTGKSMLLDLLAEGLPTKLKERWHFDTFMLYAFSRLEEFRNADTRLNMGSEEYSLLWMAKEMIEKSPILFLDEFQLPDRASSKILNNLLTAFFQLGGVLIASSNRMPEELEKATGTQYAPPATGGLVEQVLGLGKRQFGGELFGQTGDFAAFLEVLKARCDFWHMEGIRDWRRRESSVIASQHVGLEAEEDGLSEMSFSAGGLLAEKPDVVGKPALYFLSKDDSEGEKAWAEVLSRSSGPIGPHPSLWAPASLAVYGRRVPVPRQHDGTCYWDFQDLTHSFGPADYITLASNYHTFIIDKVPVLTVLMKNEARRFITCLDALYEAKCKLIVRAATGPDDLFFPGARRAGAGAEDGPARTASDDATYAETVAEVFQDQTFPFRPNISAYKESPNAKYNPAEDSDFAEPNREVDFGNVSFTGEDERFAYKRAASRLWELCSAEWHARTGKWWQPLGPEARGWERSKLSTPLTRRTPQLSASEIKLGPSSQLDGPVGLERFRIQQFLDEKETTEGKRVPMVCQNDTDPKS